MSFKGPTAFPHIGDLSAPPWRVVGVCVAVLLVLAMLYVLGMRKPMVVSRCHRDASEVARGLMQFRAQKSPENDQLQKAAMANLYVNEDYAPVYRDCMLLRGYEPS